MGPRPINREPLGFGGREYNELLSAFLWNELFRYFLEIEYAEFQIFRLSSEALSSVSNLKKS
jgi:hypothetical protein